MKLEKNIKEKLGMKSKEEKTERGQKEGKGVRNSVGLLNEGRVIPRIDQKQTNNAKVTRRIEKKG